MVRTGRTTKDLPALHKIRNEIDSRVVDMVLSTLTPHQRELLHATCGNPRIPERLAKLLRAIARAESMLGRPEHNLEEYLKKLLQRRPARA